MSIEAMTTFRTRFTIKTPPEQLEKFFEQLARYVKRHRKGIADLKEIRGIFLRVDPRWNTMGLAMDVCRFLINYGVLLEADGRYWFDPTRADVILGYAAKKQEPPPYTIVAQERILQLKQLYQTEPARAEPKTSCDPSPETPTQQVAPASPSTSRLAAALHDFEVKRRTLESTLDTRAR